MKNSIDQKIRSAIHLCKGQQKTVLFYKILPLGKTRCISGVRKPGSCIEAAQCGSRSFLYAVVDIRNIAPWIYGRGFDSPFRLNNEVAQWLEQ